MKTKPGAGKLLRLKQLAAILLVAALLPLFSACGLIRFTADTSGGLVINEVVSSNRRSLVDPALGSPDWIELYNSGTRDLDISGCGLSDNIRKPHKFVFPEGTIIKAGEYLIVYAASNSGAAATDVLCTGFGLSKGGEQLILSDGFDGLLAQMELPPLKTDISYARRADGSYGYCAVPTPGEANTEEIAASITALFAGQTPEALVLSEVMPQSDESGYPWVEVQNTGDRALELENYCLSDSGGNLLRWQFPPSTLAAGAYAVVYLSGLDDEGAGLHSSFRLGKGETRIFLSSLQGDLLDELHWEEGMPKGVSVVRGEGICYTAYPSREAENSSDIFHDLRLNEMAKDAPILISEVQKKNRVSVIDSDGDRSEWAELANFSGKNQLLHGYFLSDDPLDPYKWALPDIELPAGGYLLVFLSGKNRTDPGGELHASFRLSDEENELLLTCVDGMYQQVMPLDNLDGYNISIGLDQEGEIRYFSQPTPGYQNGRGFEIADLVGYFRTDGLYISEVSAAGAPRSRANDWIELYNGSGATIDLMGWHLSDDPAEPQKWRFPAMSIGAGEYLVVEATSHVARQTEKTATFGISGRGETIVLSDPDGALVDAFETGALEPGVTAGRIEGDASIARVFFQKATRGKKNAAEAYTGYGTMPLISVNSLYHTEAFHVEIRCADKGAVIRYTTDGSVPTETSQRYTEPIAISKSTVLRAASFTDGKMPSQVATADYLFVEPHTVPVVCIDWDPADMQRVIRTTTSKGKTEHPATMSYYEADGKLGLRFPCGIKPKGAGTLVYAQKSLSINLRASYGQNEISYPFFPNYEFTTFSALMLRNGGQDMPIARIRDAFCQNLAQAEGLYLENTPTRPVAVYLNGAYWGLYDLSEDQNSEYLQTHYGVDGDTVDIIRRNAGALSGSNREFLRLREYALNTTLSNDDTFAQFAERIDVQYFTDYFIASTYMCNTDMFNQKYWRSQDYSLKWRPVFFDLDFGFRNYKHSILEHYFSRDGVASADGSLTHFEIYIGLRKNAAWRAYCAERYVEVVVKYFNAERAVALLDEMVAERAPEMERQIARWGKPGSMKTWYANISTLRDAVQKRPEYALKHVANFFGLSNAELQALIDQYTAELALMSAAESEES